MLIFKFAAVIVAPVALLVTAINSVVTSPAEQMAAIAAGIAGVIYVWRSVLRPLAALIHRALRAYEHLEQLPHFVKQTETRLGTLETTAADNGEALAALTRELGVTVRSGERRTPRTA